MEKESSGLVQNAHNNIFVPTELGSARWVAISKDKKSSQDENKDNESGKAAVGPPWGLEQSMKSACEEAGINYTSFVRGMELNISEEDMAAEFDVEATTIKSLKNRFYHMEATNGNMGIAGM